MLFAMKNSGAHLFYLVAFSNAETLLSNSEIFLPISTFDRIGSGNAPSDLGAGHSYPPITPFLVTVSEIFSVELFIMVKSRVTLSREVHRYAH